MKMSAALITCLPLLALSGCAPPEAESPPERSTSSNTSRWVRCKKPQCSLYLTSDLAARLPGTVNPLPAYQPGQSSLKQTELALLPQKAPLNQEQGVVLVKGSYAVVSWLDSFYRYQVQIALLNTGEWELFTKPQPMGSPPPDSPAMKITCVKREGCWVQATSSFDNPFALLPLGALPCRQEMSIFLIDSDAKLALVSYPMADRDDQIQVVKYGDWKEVGGTKSDWQEPAAPPLGSCAQDQALGVKDRCQLSDGLWDGDVCATSCGPPACGLPILPSCGTTLCNGPVCRCPAHRPYWDHQQGCVPGYCPGGSAACASCSPAMTCHQAGGLCAELAWPVLETQCPANMRPATSAGTCTADALGRPRNCCLPTGGSWTTIPAGDVMLGQPGQECHLAVPAFKIQRTEVTNDEYLQCVQAQQCGLAASLQPSIVPAPAGKSAVWGVSWADADAYCRFIGARLPSAAEWVRAARGDSLKRYPWGNVYTKTMANLWESGGQGAVAVDTYLDGKSLFGVLQLIGNVREWTSSVERNACNPSLGWGGHLALGGGFKDSMQYTAIASRFQEIPAGLLGGPLPYVGVRCAAAP